VNNFTHHTPKIEKGRYRVGRPSYHEGGYMRRRKNIKRKTLRFLGLRLQAAFTALEHISLGIYLSYKTKTLTFNLLVLNLSVGIGR